MVQNPSHITLGMQPKQNMNLTQRLIMTAHMQQALHLLQVPLLELEPFLEEQVSQNPLLEFSDTEDEPSSESEEREDRESNEQELMISDKDFAILKNLEEEFEEHFAQSGSAPLKRSSEEEKQKSYIENSICAEISLYEQLMQQVRQTFEESEQLTLAETLIGYIDEYGFLKTPLTEIALFHGYSEEKLKPILQEIQTFEPYGVGASSIHESLLIQLRCLKKAHTLAYQIISHYYDDLLHNRIPIIQKGLGCTLEEVNQAIEKDIAKLDLHPGTHFSHPSAQLIVPDVSLRQEGAELFVDVNRDYTTDLRLNRRYLKMLDDPAVAKETKEYIRKHIFSAKWLMRNLQQRYSTLEKIAAYLAKCQYDFFMQPDGKLAPMTMKAVAEELGVHESTIARTVSNKYIATPRGLLSLRMFFTNAYVSESGEDLSSKTVREAIEEIIRKENKRKPLSDQAISALLKKQGIPCARRTVAKYRMALNIGNTVQRKKY